MKNQVKSVKEYLNQLPEERKIVIEKLRFIFKKNLSKDFEETLSYNMIGFVVPHPKYPEGYHCNPELPLPFISLASQKNFIALYHMGIYANKNLFDWFVTQYPKHSKYKLDMGKSCIRFKKIDDIPYDLITELAQKITADQWIKIYESVLRKK